MNSNINDIYIVNNHVGKMNDWLVSANDYHHIHNQSDILIDELKDLIILPYLVFVCLLGVFLALYLVFSLILALAVACGWTKKASLVASQANSADKKKGGTGIITPRHIAVIMDGNRRYGKSMYGVASQGHHAGGRTLSNFVDWSIEEGVEVLTCYAFSTENWKRSKEEIDCLMTIFHHYCNEIMATSISKNIRIRVLSSDEAPIPDNLSRLFREMETKTRHCNGFSLNLAVSYGSRSEITRACRSVAQLVEKGAINPGDITEDLISEHLLTGSLPPVDLMIRTSEVRLSNFLLWQLAYSELVFLSKNWPEVTHSDLRDAILTFSSRQRRFGK